MADPVQLLKAKKEQILAEAKRQVEALDSDARELERMQSLAEKYGLVLTEKPVAVQKTSTGTVTESPAPQLQLTSSSANIGAVPAYKQAFAAAEKLVRGYGHPMELKDIFPRLIEQGVPLAGVRPQSTLSAYLSHPKSPMLSVRKGLWWLKGEPIPDE